MTSLSGETQLAPLHRKSKMKVENEGRRKAARSILPLSGLVASRVASMGIDSIFSAKQADIELTKQ
jgi:hypothetical protein